MPSAPPFGAMQRTPPVGILEWTNRYDMRFVRGRTLDAELPEDQRDAVSELWIRDEPPRPIDFLSLAALCDTFFPRIMVRRLQRVPAGTVSITTYFHADAALLAAQGDRPVFGAARASHFGRGYHDQSAEVWGEGGALLANSHQIVYFKE